MHGVNFDITGRKQVEESLRQSESQFRALAESIPQLAWMAEPDGHIFWYNKRWFEYTGTTLETMKGWGWQSVHDPEFLPAVMEQWRASIEQGTPFEMVFPLRGSDGRFRPFLTRILPVKDEHGKVVRWFGTNTDIEAQKQAEDELKRANRHKDEFLAMLAHELRNPLSPIRNAVHLLKFASPNDPTLVGARHDRPPGDASGAAGRRPSGREPDHPGQDRSPARARGPGRHRRIGHRERTAAHRSSAAPPGSFPASSSRWSWWPTRPAWPRSS